MTENPCVFCKIKDKEIKSEILYESHSTFAIRDIRPLAKKHFLIIPKTHVRDIDEAFTSPAGVEMVGEMFESATVLARQQGLKDGYRLVINCGKDAGQDVFHLHLHILGGEALGPSCHSAF